MRRDFGMDTGKPGPPLESFRFVSRFSFLVSRFSFLVSRFSFLVSRFSFLVSRFSFLVSRFSFLVSRFVSFRFVASFLSGVLQIRHASENLF